MQLPEMLKPKAAQELTEIAFLATRCKTNQSPKGHLTSEMDEKFFESLCPESQEASGVHSKDDTPPCI